MSQTIFQPVWLVLVRKIPVFVNFHFLSMILQLIKKKKKSIASSTVIFYSFFLYLSGVLFWVGGVVRLGVDNVSTPHLTQKATAKLNKDTVFRFMETSF